MVGDADGALVGAADELSKYVLCIGQRCCWWKNSTPPGEGATVIHLARAEDAPTPLAHVTGVRFRDDGGDRSMPNARPIGSARLSTFATIDVVLSGANGRKPMDRMYADAVMALTARAGHPLVNRTYKQVCGDHHSASAFGFTQAVELVQRGSRGVLLYTLSASGAKAICCIQPS